MNKIHTCFLVGLMVAAALVVPAQAQEDKASRFSIGVLPDTQFYSRYATEETGNLFSQRYGSEPFESQTAWLAAHDEALNMPFVTHLGDVVDQSHLKSEWEVADQAMAILEREGLNYSILPGNHDMARNAQGSYFSQYFPTERAAKNSSFGARFEKLNNESEYHIFEAEGQRYLVLALAWRASEETLSWAQQVLDSHPELPVILTSHEILNIDGQGEVFLSEDYGQYLWEEFIARNDQIFLTLAGHHHGAGHMVMKNDAGHDVIHVLQDYQMAYQGGNGLLGLLQFDLSNNELSMTALSPWVATKPARSLNKFDELILDGAHSWSESINFTERFSGFAPDFTAGSADDPDYGALARRIVSAGYQPPVIAPGDLPQHPQDYVIAENTAVHWRPGSTSFEGRALVDGESVPVGSIIPDISGNANDLTRAALNTRGASGAELSDVVVRADTHPLSSDRASLQWANQEGDSSSLNWFETAADAAINQATFDHGYTFEAFIKIGEDFDADNHWMGAISRQGAREEITAGIEEGEEPPAALAVSSLREMQWTSVATKGNTTGTSNWSHEVPAGQWMHIAIVNDPDANTVEMFIDGAPILRDVINASGLASAGDPWLIGANMWHGDPANPWYGSIGEIRIVDGALGPDQWLTARSQRSAEGSSLGSVLHSSFGSTHWVRN